MLKEKIKGAIELVPDFPKKGILFRDITPVFGDADLFREVQVELITRITMQMNDWNAKSRIILSPEARGFIVGASVCAWSIAGFVPARKAGKLPGSVDVANYDLEYGKNSLSVHMDSIKATDCVAVVDDILATGGTAGACVEIARRQRGKVVGCFFIGEIKDLGGREKLEAMDVRVESLVML